MLKASYVHEYVTNYSSRELFGHNTGTTTKLELGTVVVEGFKLDACIDIVDPNTAGGLRRSSNTENAVAGVLHPQCSSNDCAKDTAAAGDLFTKFMQYEEVNLVTYGDKVCVCSSTLTV